jgi:hypothetical protein
MRILVLDQQGHPREWRSKQDAIMYHAKNLVAWELGENEAQTTYRGGTNRITGKLSTINTAPIIAVKSKVSAAKRSSIAAPLTNPALFRRDRHMCAYCGKTFSENRLTRDHIVPTSRGGADTWMNVVSACESCNHRKDDSMLSECGFELLFQPYIPNKVEALIFENRHIILECQMAYLENFIPANSRAKKILGEA